MANPLIRMISEERGEFDKLYAPRLEAWFKPNQDGTPSLSGNLSFYTQWWHFRNNLAFSQSDGQRIEYNFNELLTRDWVMADGRIIPGIDILMGMEAMFNTLATEALTVVEAEDEPQPSQTPYNGPTPLEVQK